MIKEILQDYLEALVEGDMERLLQLFEPDGMVKSPLYGNLPAIEFYTQLENDTAFSNIHLLSLFEDKETQKGVAHFIYHWKLANGNEVEFECADIFEFSDEGKISLLTILYDTAALKPGNNY